MCWLQNDSLWWSYLSAHWPTHKESCDGRLRKIGMDHLNKARGFHRDHNWPQLLRYSDLAVTKLMQLKDRPLEDISEALELKCTALDFLGRHREQLECAKEWYCLWNTKPADVGAINAAFALTSSCLHNQKWADAHLYASTLYGIINHKHDNKIPDDKRQRYIARGAYNLAHATLRLAQSGGIPREEEKKAGQETIALLRKALEIHTELHGTECNEVANCMCILADALGFFSADDDDDEALRLFERTKTIHSRVYGSLSVSVAICEGKIANLYARRAKRGHDVNNDFDREKGMLELSLTHYRESARIYRAIGRMNEAESKSKQVVYIEVILRRIAITRVFRG